MSEPIKDIFEDERVLFVAASSGAVYNLWISQFLLGNTISWTVVLLWAVIVLVGLRLKRHIVRAETWRESLEAGTFTRKAAIQFYVLAIALLTSTLVPLLLASLLESTFFPDPPIGALVGLDGNIAYRWLKRHRKQ